MTTEQYKNLHVDVKDFVNARTHDASLRATLRHEVARNVADDGHTVKQLRVMLQK